MIEESAHRRTQALTDIGVTLGITVLAWPFPLARAALSPTAHVTAVLASWVLIGLVYHAVCATVWRRTVGMRLTGRMIVPVGEARWNRGRAIVWGLASGMLAPWYVVSPATASRFGVPEQVSGLRMARLQE